MECSDAIVVQPILYSSHILKKNNCTAKKNVIKKEPICRVAMERQTQQQTYGGRVQEGERVG